MSRRHSDLPIWNFFEKPTDGSKIATCNYCHRELSYRTSVTNLKQHLKQKHSSVYNIFTNIVKGKTFESTAPETDARQERLPRIETGGEPPASSDQLEAEWLESEIPTTQDSVVDNDFENQPTVKILTNFQPEEKRQRPTYFVSVKQDREKQNRRPNHGTRLKRPVVKDRINSIIKRDLRTEKKDEYTTYGELVAMKLKKIENSYARSTAQYHINNILYKAEIGIYNKPPKANGSHNSKDHVTAETLTMNVTDDDVLSQRSSSPLKTDYDLKLEDSDEYSS